MFNLKNYLIKPLINKTQRGPKSHLDSFEKRFNEFHFCSCPKSVQCI